MLISNTAATSFECNNNKNNNSIDIIIAQSLYENQ